MPLLATLRRAHTAWVTFFLLAFATGVMPTAAQAWDITGSSRPGSDVNADGKDDVVWYQNGGTNAAHVLLGGSSSLSYAGQWRTGLGVPDWAGLGDFNGDGKDEPAWFHAGGSPAGTVSVLPSNGTSFGATPWISGLGRPNWVGVGDFNNDQKDDLAWYHATGSSAQTVSVLLSTGTSFNYAGSWATGLGVPDWAGVGDFDFDGKDDLAWYHSDGSGTIHVLKSTGTGFAYSGQWATGYGRPDWATTGDFNGDRKDDIAWYHSDGSSPKTVSVILSSGSAFTYNGQWATGIERPEWAGVGDYNGDGKDDLSWYRPGTGTSGNLNVLRNTGSSSFAAQTSWAGGLGRPQWAGNGSRPIQSTGAGADFNNDGADDLFWYHASSQNISGVFSDGSGAFSLVSTWRTGMANADWTGAGDFNRDGKEDIAWYHKENSQAISVARSDGTKFDSVGVWRDGMGNPDWAGVGDFTGDGRDDIAWYHKESQKISVARSDGTKFDLVNVWREGMGKPDWAGVGDFNGDGKDDIAWYHKENSQAISVALSDGSSFYTVSAWRTGMGRPDWAGVGDFTGDGRDDIAWYHSGGSQAISVLWSDGSSFPSADVWRTGMGMPDWSGVGSFNGDTKDDIAWYHKENSQAISVAWSNGGSFNTTSVARTGMGVPDWAGPGDISRRYPTSWDYGAANHRVDTPGEADAVIDAIRGSGDAAASTYYNELSPTDQNYVVARMDSKWPSSRTYGGANWKVEGASEADAFTAAFLAAGSDVAAMASYNGLQSSDAGVVDARIRGGYAFGVVYRDASGVNKYWEYEDGTRARITSRLAAEEFGFDLTAAVRTTPGALALVAQAETIDYIAASDDADEMDDVGDFVSSALASPLGLSVGKTYSCKGSGSTVRNAGNKFVTGYCLGNASITVRGIGKWPTKKTPAPGGKWYYVGAIGGNYKRCGWLQTPGAVEANENANPQPYTIGCSRRGIAENVFAAEIYDGWQEDRKTSGTCTRWRNVDWNATDPSSSNARWDEKTTVTIPANTDIQVRYRTKGGAFYMTRYVINGARDSAWAFLSKNCVDGANWSGRSPVNRPSPATPEGYESW